MNGWVYILAVERCLLSRTSLTSLAIKSFETSFYRSDLGRSTQHGREREGLDYPTRFTSCNIGAATRAGELPEHCAVIRSSRARRSRSL